MNALVGSGRVFSSGSAPDRPGILHRLDKDTSGVLLVAKTDRAHLMLSEQFRDRTVHKLYLALSWGTLDRDSVEVDAPIGRHAVNRKKMAIREDGRPAQTRGEHAGATAAYQPCGGRTAHGPHPPGAAPLGPAPPSRAGGLAVRGPSRKRPSVQDPAGKSAPRGTILPARAPALLPQSRGWGGRGGIARARGFHVDDGGIPRSWLNPCPNSGTNAWLSSDAGRRGSRSPWR